MGKYFYYIRLLGLHEGCLLIHHRTCEDHLQALFGCYIYLKDHWERNVHQNENGFFNRGHFLFKRRFYIGTIEPMEFSCSIFVYIIHIWWFKVENRKIFLIDKNIWGLHEGCILRNYSKGHLMIVLKLFILKV